MARKAKTEEKEELKYYKSLHGKSMRQIRQDASEEAPKEEIVEEKSPIVTEEKPEVKENENREKEEARITEIAKKAAEETASKMKAETEESFRVEMTKILGEDKDLVEKQKAADALISSWDKEKRLPKNYKEVIDETMRIAETKMEQAWKEREEARLRETKELEEKTIKDKEEREDLARKQEVARLENFNKQIAEDLNDLYEAKMLPRPTSFEEVNNDKTEDTGAIETQKVLKFGVELNRNRVKEGKEPVSSLSKIYFLYYKPSLNVKSDQPAGNDAPVSGATNINTSSSSKVTPYAQLHRETWTQTRARVAREQARRKSLL